jgi:hypothetical protein
VNLHGTEDGFQPTGAEPAMGVQHLTGRLWNAQRKAHISVATELEMSLKQHALHFTALGLLLRLNHVGGKL